MVDARVKQQWEWMRSFKDKVDDRIPLSIDRPKRKVTDTLVVHGFGDGDRGVIGDSPADVERFFTSDPEGVSTVTQTGAWAERVRTFKKWWRTEEVPSSWLTANGIPKREHRWDVPTRIPVAFAARAYVPYTFGIDAHGHVVQWLGWDDQGAHAVGYNHRSVSVALIRDIRSTEPLPEAQGAALANLVTYVCLRAPVEVITHDQANQSRGLRPKGCPGVDVSQAVRWGQLRAQNIQDPRR